MAVTPFLITGLPRSRTAWLSVVCSSGVSVCHHEPTDGAFRAAERLWSDPGPWEYVGISEAALGLEIGRVLEAGIKTLIVERDFEAVLASFYHYAAPLNYGPAQRYAIRRELGTLESRLKRVGDHPLVRRVAFEDLNDVNTVRDCLNWLMPGVAVPHLDRLMSMNVQSDLGFNLEKLRRSMAT